MAYLEDREGYEKAVRAFLERVTTPTELPVE